MTVRLFDDDGYLWNFEAGIRSLKETENGCEVILDRTAFAPEGGGQLSDIGFLGGAEVYDVRARDGEIVHFTHGKPVGEIVVGQIDGKRRLRHLQNHTGEHIAVGLIHNEYGMNNVGFHLGHEDVTFDVDGTVTVEMLRHIERLANEVVAKNLPVRAYYPSKEELKSLSFRAKGEIEGDVRIVEIEGVDACACCVPHVRRTGEIGGIKLIGCMRYKGGTRVHMKCGLDAIDEANVEHDRVLALSNLLSLPGDRVVEGVEKLLSDLGEAKRKITELKNAAMEIKVRSIAPGEGDILFIESENDPALLRTFALRASENTDRRVAVFGGSDEIGYSFVIIDKKNFEETRETVREKLVAKGGGKAPLLQGNAACRASDILQMFHPSGN